jgi:hypothetical protein
MEDDMRLIKVELTEAQAWALIGAGATALEEHERDGLRNASTMRALDRAVEKIAAQLPSTALQESRR